MKHLRELQLRFQDYLIRGTDDIEQDIISTENALAEHRLGAYYNAYRIRLIDCLAVDYSALQKYLGRESLRKHGARLPAALPVHPSLGALVWQGSACLPARFLQRRDNAEFVQELASYEWTQSIVFDAANSEQLFQLEDMAQVAAEAWPGLTFEFQPAMRWLDLYWNVPTMERALDADTELPQLQRADYPQRWLLWRQDMKTHWRSLEVHEAWAIEQASKGANFAEICEGLLEWIDEQQVALAGAGFLKQWISDNLLTQLRQ